MSSPIDEKPYQKARVDDDNERSSGEHTFVESPSHPTHQEKEKKQRGAPLHLNVERIRTNDSAQTLSPSRAREYAHRLGDDMELWRAEQVASRSSDLQRVRTGRSKNPVDDFDEQTNPGHQPHGVWRPPTEPASRLAKLLKTVHESSVFVRYFTYIVPVVLILLIPLLLGVFTFTNANVGGVHLMWFMIWLEIVWLSLWIGRIVAKLIPYPVGTLMSAFTNGAKKWRDMCKCLEVPATLFFWWLGIYVSFTPTMTNHHVNGSTDKKTWERDLLVVLLSLFIAAVLNLIEKIIVQLIAISFHTRTYADRIELNKFQIGSLAKLYRLVKERERQFEEEERERAGSVMGSGMMTPGAVLNTARRGAQIALTQVGDALGKIAGDFTGKQVSASTSPQQIVLTLLQTTEGSQVLARRLYRSFARQDAENVHAEDLAVAFTDDDEAEAAFSMFDRDLNGDISCEEMELSCVEVGRERKAITASLKDLDSVVGKLDDVLTFIVLVIVILVFLSLISKSTAGVLTSASSSVLALSWLFSATAQEFLASLIFVFVKHPFDVGDRVDVYNTGAGTIDTFFVKEISLMYTEFKKLEGNVVQAPNSLLNTLFILNQRRSGALAEAIPIAVKFGTSLEQIEELREHMLEFVKSEKREYQGKILTELRDLPNIHSVTLNVVFFYKSNWQNELVRMQRRNKFMCALMCSVHEVGIEGPNMRWPGQKLSAPLFLQGVQADRLAQSVVDRDNNDGKSPAEFGSSYNADPYNPSPVEPHPAGTSSPPEVGGHYESEYDGVSRSRSRSAATARARKVDFSLGLKDISASDDSGDVFGINDDRKMPKLSQLRQLNRVMEEEEDAARRMSSHSSGRHSFSRGSGSDAAPSASAGSMWHRRPRSGSTASHRNRFFGRREAGDEEMAIDPSNLRRASTVGRPSTDGNGSTRHVMHGWGGHSERKEEHEMDHMGH